MVALLTFSIVGLTALHDSVGQWSGQIEGSLSIQVPPTELTNRTPAEREAALQGTVDSIIEQVSTMPGIARIEELSPDTMAALLEPWLGPDEVISELPIPRIIEVTPETGFNFDAVERRLGVIAPEAVLDDHRIWIERISRCCLFGRTGTGPFDYCVVWRNHVVCRVCHPLRTFDPSSHH